MADKTQLPYGRWPSRITPKNTGGLLDLSETAWDRTGGLLWRERSSTRASIRIADPNSGKISTISGDFNAGGGLLYGGGSFGISKDSLIFVDRTSKELIKISLKDNKATQFSSGLDFSASPVISPDGLAVLFVHSDGERDAIFISDLQQGLNPVPIISGGDFYNYPRWHPQGDQVAWVSWNHPHMPWDSSTLWLGSLEIFPGDKPRLISKSLIAGGDGTSVLQPEFSPDGKWLAYISDQSGWWQIHIYDLTTGEVKQLTVAPAEHALPPWLQNRNAYGFSLNSKKIYFLRNQDGLRSLWVKDLDGERESEITLDGAYSWLDWFSISPRDDRMAMIASAGNLPPQLITVEPSGKVEIILRSNQEVLPRNLFSLPTPVSWLTLMGTR